MFRPRSAKSEPRKKRAWEQEAEAEDDDGPSEAFLLLQKELEEKETIQRENEERAKDRQEEMTKEAKALFEKEERRKANAKNPKVFLEIEVADDVASGSRLKKGERVGKIVFELFEDAVPRTAENFRALCTGEKPRGASGFPLCFLGNIFHRIVPKFMAQGGDITREDGSGGESIYGTTFDDENFERKHDAPGLLSMANSGRNTNNSQFFITFATLPWLDGKHVVFGKVIEGMEIVRKIEDCGTTSGEPTRRVQIAECGQVPEEDEKPGGEQSEKDESDGDGDGDGDGDEGKGGEGGDLQRRTPKRSRVTFSSSDSPDARRDGPD